MKEKIKNYIESVFKEVRETKEVKELKDELYANLLDKYNDSLKSGKAEMESYTSAISSIGNVNELIRSVSDFSDTCENNCERGISLNKFRGRHERLLIGTSIAIAVIFAVSITSVISTNNYILAFISCLVAAAVAVFLVYRRKQLYSLSHSKTEEERIIENYSKEYKSFRIGFWLLAVFTYLAACFYYGAWNYCWIIFFFAQGVDILSMTFYMVRHKTEASKNYAFKYFIRSFWLFTMTIYFVTSFYYGMWSYSWLIFIMAWSFVSIVKGFYEIRKASK